MGTGTAETTIQGGRQWKDETNQQNYEHGKMFSFQNTYNLTFLLRN